MRQLKDSRPRAKDFQALDENFFVVESVLAQSMIPKDSGRNLIEGCENQGASHSLALKLQQ